MRIQSGIGFDNKPYVALVAKDDSEARLPTPLMEAINAEMGPVAQVVDTGGN